MQGITGEQTINSQPSGRPGRSRRRWLIVLAALIVILICLVPAVVLHHGPSIDEQLAAIEAARAIPDGENAAILYNQLMRHCPVIGDVSEAVDKITRYEPWRKPAYPEVARWIEQHADVIEALLHISRLQECRFALDVEARYSGDSRNLIRQWIWLLQRDACNDIAEGHIDDAIEKCRCLLQFAEHYRQQPTLIDQLLSCNIESAGLSTFANIVMDEGLDPHTLDAIAALPIQTHLTWTTRLEDIISVEDLFAQQRRRNMPFVSRLRAWLTEDSAEEYVAQLPRVYERLLSRRRGMHVLLALKRHRIATGRWPADLAAIRASLAEEVLTDPQNGDGYAYRLTSDGVVLYSKGPNGVDEGGRWKGPADDKPIWPWYGAQPSAKKEEANDDG